MQLQMAHQSIRFSKGIAIDIMVKIQDHYALADFMILDIEEEDDSPIILGRPFLNTTNASSMLDLDKSTSNSLEKRYAVTLIVILLMISRRSPAPGGDIDHPADKRINSLRMDGETMK
jgi:hypothetical protein